MLRNKTQYILLSICLSLLISSNRSFNKVERPFTHRVVITENPNGWKYLSLREQIAQLIMVRVNGKFYNSESSYKRNLKRWISEDGIGGVIAFGGNVHGTYYNIQEFQSWAKNPLIVASDLERGLGQWVGGTLFPTNMAIAATQDRELAYQQGYITATEALAMGIHVIFAPVMDINNNPDNPIINFRSYSDDPLLVSEFGTSFIKGINSGGAISCAKHYPGHGNTSTDSHTSLPTIEGTREELNQMELYPFQAAIDSGVGMIMVGHIAMPGLDPSGEASSQSKLITSDLLKDQMGFDGIVVTDALEMGGITKLTSAGEACVRAIEAGADIVLLPLDVTTAINSIYDAVMNGRISEERIGKSVDKIWNSKIKLNLFNNKSSKWSDVEDNIGLSKNTKASQFMANKSITLVKNEKNIVPLKPSKLKKITHLILSMDDDAGRYLKTFHRDLKRTHRGVKKMLINDKLSDSRINGIIEDLKGSSVVVISMLIRIRMDKGESTIDKTHAALLERIQSEGIPTVGISFGSPYLPSYESLDAYMCAYGYGSISVKAAANAIWGRSNIEGELPVSLSENYKRGHGIKIKARKFSFNDNSLNYNLDSAWEIIEGAISNELFPGAQIVVVKNNQLVAEKSFGKLSYSHDSRDVDSSTIYDIASITKVLSVTPITMKLISQKKISLEHTLEQYYPQLYNTDKGKISIRNLLTHSSGMKPFVEFYKKNPKIKKNKMINEILNLDVDFSPGEKVQYSDLGIIVLMDIIEKVSGSSLDDLCNRWIFNPIDMNNTFYNPDASLKSKIAPTEEDDYFRNRLLQGEVHDENAYLLGGVSGHAGIFSNAYDLAKYAQLFLNEGTWLGNRIFSDYIVDEFTSRQNLPKGSDYALGWDTPSINGKSSAGDFFSNKSYGHLGFTGTSLWIDSRRDIIVVLLTNRVHPTRMKKGMYSLRRNFHTEIMKAIL